MSGNFAIEVIAESDNVAFKLVGMFLEAIEILEVESSGSVLGEIDDVRCYCHSDLRFE